MYTREKVEKLIFICARSISSGRCSHNDIHIRAGHAGDTENGAAEVHIRDRLVTDKRQLRDTPADSGFDGSDFRRADNRDTDRTRMRSLFVGGPG